MNDWTTVVPDGGVGVHAVAAMDIGLRTALASLITVSAAPRAFRPGGGSDERRSLEFLARLGATTDASSLFVAPPPGIEMRARRHGRLPWAPEIGRVDMLSYKSPYQVLNPALRAAYASHTRNAIGRAQHWRHDDGPRPTIIVVHGFAGSPYWFNSAFFSLPWFYSHGCDVMLATLPFHGARGGRRDPFNGYGIFAHGMGSFGEAMLQGICDLRVLVNYLEETGVQRIGITGYSLGGYMTALMAAAEPRLHVAIPNAAVTDLGNLMDDWFPAGKLLRVALSRAKVSQSEFQAAMRLHSPLRFPSAIPKDRLFVVGGLGDRLAPPHQSALLWEHWGRPRIHWYAGNHLLQFGRGRYLREIGRFLRDTGFSPG